MRNRSRPRCGWPTAGTAPSVAPLAEVGRIEGGPGGTGPGDAILGDLAGRRVLDLGCGPGRHAAHLARRYRAVVDAVAAAPSQIERARAHYADVPGLRLVTADAVEYVLTAAPYDVIYSLNAFPTSTRAGYYPP